MQEIQASIPVHKLGWEKLQAVSSSRLSTYGFQQGAAIWIYEKLNDPQETLYHEYCHIYEVFYLNNPDTGSHGGWYVNAPAGYRGIYTKVKIKDVFWM